MEGVPRISMMSFPMKKSAENPNFKHKLKAFIRDHYNEDAESYNQELHELESLRAGAIHTSKDVSGCSTLKKYFCQLNFLKSRFPMYEGGLCAISFSWFDVFTETVIGWPDIEYEMSCILYNIGALHSELGAADNRQTADGMKNACTHFQCAAWAFQHLRHNYQKFFSADISPDTLSIMTNVCLAQAQECIFEKSLIDNRKSTITAKVTLQIVEYYQLAMKTSEQFLKDSSQYSDKVVKAVKRWKKLIELKTNYYQCVSFLFRGMQAEDDNKWGDRVTFYKSALESLTTATSLAKFLDKTDNVHETLQFTYDVVQGKVAIAEKENEYIYHEKVVELSAIGSDIKGVSLVKGIPFKFDDPQIAGPDIFGRLVPMEAHEASSLYSEEKAKILRNYSSKIEAKNEALDKMIIALQLDQLDFHTSTKKVPQELIDCCAALSVNKDAIKRLSESMNKLSGLYHDVEDYLEEIQQLLEDDSKKDADFQSIVGPRAANSVLADINKEFQRYKSAHVAASETNQLLHEAMTKHVGNLNILMKPFDEVLKYIPSLDEEGVVDEEAVNRMKKLIGKVDEMRKQRIKYEQDLRDSLRDDDITKQLVVKKDQDLESVFQEELQKHDKITQVLDQNLLAQENIMRALTEANADYAETRKATNQILKRREKVVNDLLASYEAYDELLEKCSNGVEFYTKLDASAQKLLQRTRSVCKVQEEERKSTINSIMIKKDPLMSGMQNLSMNPLPGQPPWGGATSVAPVNNYMNPTNSSVSGGGHLKLKDYLAMKKTGGSTPSAPSQQSQSQPTNATTSGYDFQPNAVPNLSQYSPQLYQNPMGSVPGSGNLPTTSYNSQSYAGSKLDSASINSYMSHQGSHETVSQKISDSTNSAMQSSSVAPTSFTPSHNYSNQSYQPSSLNMYQPTVPEAQNTTVNVSKSTPVSMDTNLHQTPYGLSQVKTATAPSLKPEVTVPINNQPHPTPHNPPSVPHNQEPFQYGRAEPIPSHPSQPPSIAMSQSQSYQSYPATYPNQPYQFNPSNMYQPQQAPGQVVSPFNSSSSSFSPMNNANLSRNNSIDGGKSEVKQDAVSVQSYLTHAGSIPGHENRINQPNPCQIPQSCPEMKGTTMVTPQPPCIPSSNSYFQHMPPSSAGLSSMTASGPGSLTLTSQAPGNYTGYPPQTYNTQAFTSQYNPAPLSSQSAPSMEKAVAPVTPGVNTSSNVNPQPSNPPSGQVSDSEYASTSFLAKYCKQHMGNSSATTNTSQLNSYFPFITSGGSGSASANWYQQQHPQLPNTGSQQIGSMSSGNYGNQQGFSTSPFSNNQNPTSALPQSGAPGQFPANASNYYGPAGSIGTPNSMNISQNYGYQFNGTSNTKPN